MARYKTGTRDLTREEKRFLNRQARPVLAILVIMILSLVVLFGAQYLPNGAPRMMELLAARPSFQGASHARLMLEICRIWYLTLLGIFALTWLGMIVSLIFLVRNLIKSAGWLMKHLGEIRELEKIQARTAEDEIKELLDPDLLRRAMDLDPGAFPERDRAPSQTWTEEREETYQNLRAQGALHNTIIMLLVVGIPLAVMVMGLHGLLIWKEEVPDLLSQTVEDIRQLEAGECPSFTVWLSPKARAVHLPGPYSSSQTALLTRYGAISEETGGVWVQVYVPEGMDFTLDPDRLYNENQSICWNQENARQYVVEYTPNLCFVVSAEPVETGPCEK